MTTKPAAKGGPAGPRAESKSAAIRDYAKRNRGAGPTAISNALEKKGVKVSPAHVSNVLTAARKKKAGKAASANGAPKKRSGRAATNGEMVSVASLVEARKFASQVGGVDKAVTLLNSLAKLQ